MSSPADSLRAATTSEAPAAVLLVVALVAGYLVFISNPALQRMLRPDAVRGLLDGLSVTTQEVV